MDKPFTDLYHNILALCENDELEECIAEGNKVLANPGRPSYYKGKILSILGEITAGWSDPSEYCKYMNRFWHLVNAGQPHRQDKDTDELMAVWREKIDAIMESVLEAKDQPKDDLHSEEGVGGSSGNDHTQGDEGKSCHDAQLHPKNEHEIGEDKAMREMKSNVEEDLILTGIPPKAKSLSDRIKPQTAEVESEDTGDISVDATVEEYQAIPDSKAAQDTGSSKAKEDIQQDNTSPTPDEQQPLAKPLRRLNLRDKYNMLLGIRVRKVQEEIAATSDDELIAAYRVEMRNQDPRVY